MSRKPWALLVLLPAVTFGCGPAKTQQEEARPPEVMVSQPVKDSLVNFEVFTGRTQSMNRVDLRARATGYLDKVYVGRDGDVRDGQKPFDEGGDVKKGDVLFVLQQKPFQDALTQAERALDQLLVQRDFNKRSVERIRTSGVGSSPSDLDTAETAYRASEAQVAAARATGEIARQNLDWATIRAPFAGRIGKRLVDRGNDVKADDTILATLEQIDPLYAYFDVDERTTLRISRYLDKGRVPEDAAELFPVTLGLANEKPEQFAHQGTLLFADNKVDPGTGTLRMWGTFDNSKRDLKSGMFARVRMGIGGPEQTLFVTESALNSDQGRKYVFVVDEDNKIVYTPVEAGQTKDGLIAVKGVNEGALTESSRVVIDGLQRVKAGQEVTPKAVGRMPRATDDAAGPPEGGAKGQTTEKKGGS